MPSGWEPETDNQEWGDRESWRGDQHPEGTDDWCPEGDEDSVWAAAEDDNSEHDAGWPEDLAGPEYWLFKRDCNE